MTRILVVEDSATQAVEIQAYLEEESYDVDVAENGVVALKRIADQFPDVVLTDVVMPEMNGLELVNAIRLQYTTIPVILMTAQGNDVLAVEALEHGAAAYIPKSKLDEMLFNTLDQVLGLVRADRTYSRLIECLDYNEIRFTLVNDTALIDPLVDLMQQMAFGIRLCDAIGRVRIGMALEHALTNALYHGNLQVSREELERESEVSLVDQRRSEEPYCNRKIHFSAQLTADEAHFVIRDDGPGFDRSTVPAASDPHMLEREGGRGLVLMRSFMDEVTFNDKSNEVTMIKRREVTEESGLAVLGW